MFAAAVRFSTPSLARILPMWVRTVPLAHCEDLTDLSVPFRLPCPKQYFRLAFG
jgi:hypothetical protein